MFELQLHYSVTARVGTGGPLREGRNSDIWLACAGESCHWIRFVSTGFQELRNELQAGIRVISIRLISGFFRTSPLRSGDLGANGGVHGLGGCGFHVGRVAFGGAPGQGGDGSGGLQPDGGVGDWRIRPMVSEPATGVGGGVAPRRSAPLDSCLRRNDERGGRKDERGGRKDAVGAREWRSGGAEVSGCAGRARVGEWSSELGVLA